MGSALTTFGPHVPLLLDCKRRLNLPSAGSFLNHRELNILLLVPPNVNLTSYVQWDSGTSKGAFIVRRNVHLGQSCLVWELSGDSDWPPNAYEYYRMSEFDAIVVTIDGRLDRSTLELSKTLVAMSVPMIVFILGSSVTIQWNSRYVSSFEAAEQISTLLKPSQPVQNVFTWSQREFAVAYGVAKLWERLLYTKWTQGRNISSDLITFGEEPFKSRTPGRPAVSSSVNERNYNYTPTGHGAAMTPKSTVTSGKTQPYADGYGIGQAPQVSSTISNYGGLHPQSNSYGVVLRQPKTASPAASVRSKTTAGAAASEPNKFRLAVVGEALVGKSSLINAILGLRDGESGAAPVSEEGTDPVFRSFRSHKRPDLFVYEVSYGNEQLERLDQVNLVLLVIGDRLLESDRQVATQLHSKGVKFLLIRSKADRGVDQVKRREKNMADSRAKRKLREEVLTAINVNNLKHKVPEENVFVLSSWKLADGSVDFMDEKKFQKRLEELIYAANLPKSSHY